MIKEILKLLEVQEIDLNIIDMVKLQKSLPEELQHLKKDVELKKKNLDNAVLTARDTKAKQKTLEVELEGSKSTALKYKGQLFQIKSNDQYKALLQEIDQIEKKMASIEDKILGVMFEIDEKDALVKQAESELKQSEEQYRFGQEEIQQKIRKVEQDTQTLRDNRARLKKDIDPKAFQLYERIMKNKQGSSIVPVVGNICQGCFMKLTPNDVNEVHKCVSIRLCENCSRILYYIPPSEEK